MRKFLVFICLILLAGCATIDPKVTNLEKKVAMLERQMRQMQMAGATGAGANFYPYSGGLDGGGTGQLDKTTNTADKDIGLVAVNQDYVGAATEGFLNGLTGGWFSLYGLNDNAGSGDSWPAYGASGDGGNERWQYLGHLRTETEFIPAWWMDITDGGADPPQSTYSTASNSREYRIITFDGVTDEDATFLWMVPWDMIGTKLKVRWIGIITNATGPSNEAISFGIDAVTVADTEEGGIASFSDTAVTKSAITQDQDDIIISSFVEITIAELSPGEVALFHVNRDADGNDTYAQDFGLIGIEIRYPVATTITY